MTTDPLVVFTPSGKRGHFPVGTPILTAARQLGVDLDSVCGGRGICSKCQITPSYGEFPKHGVTVSDGALSEWNAVEQRYDDKRGLKPGRRLGCQATRIGIKTSLTIAFCPGRESQSAAKYARIPSWGRPVLRDAQFWGIGTSVGHSGKPNPALFISACA